MSSQQSTVDFILEQMAGAGPVSARRMFGEYGVFFAGRIVAVVCDDRLYIKPTAAGRARIGAVEEALPFPRTKPWFLISGEHWDDADFLADIVRVTADALPPPRPKRPPKSRRR